MLLYPLLPSLSRDQKVHISGHNGSGKVDVKQRKNLREKNCHKIYVLCALELVIYICESQKIPEIETL